MRLRLTELGLYDNTFPINIEIEANGVRLGYVATEQDPGFRIYDISVTGKSIF